MRRHGTLENHMEEGLAWLRGTTVYFGTLPHSFWPYTAELSSPGSPCWAGGMKTGWKHGIQTRPGGCVSLSEDVLFPRQQAGPPTFLVMPRLSMWTRKYLVVSPSDPPEQLTYNFSRLEKLWKVNEEEAGQ